MPIIRSLTTSELAALTGYSSSSILKMLHSMPRSLWVKTSDSYLFDSQAVRWILCRKKDTRGRKKINKSKVLAE